MTESDGAVFGLRATVMDGDSATAGDETEGKPKAGDKPTDCSER